MIESKRRFILGLGACCTVVPSIAFAQSLTLGQAKQRGLVGEQLNGYLGIVQSSSDVDALVRSVNLQRKQLYGDVAQKNGVPLADVEKLAGQKAVNEAASGTIVQSPGGGWMRKP